jgi:hypothetical protein
MSIKARLLQQENSHGVFAVIGGQRLDGKSTLAGTLPGKTLLLQASELETGSSSAMALAAELGNDLSILTFESFGDLLEILQDKEVLDYDNLYIDGISAINEMRYECDDVQKAQKKSVWDGYRILGDDLRKLLRNAKKMTMVHGINIFFTLAYKAKMDANGNISVLEPDIKGNVTIAEIQRLCPTVLAIRKKFDEDGNIGRELLTNSDEIYPARMERFLDHNNPGVVEPNLTTVLNLIKEV